MKFAQSSKNTAQTFTSRLAALALSLPLSIVGVQKAQAKIIFSSDFNQGTKGFVEQTEGCSNSKAFSTVSTPARAGGKALKIAMKDCDKRSEIYVKAIEDGEEHWAGWSLYIPKDYPINGNRPSVFQQLPIRMWGKSMLKDHLKKECSNPAKHDMKVKSGKFIYTGLLVDNKRKEIGCRNYSLQLKQGQWTDFVMYVKTDGVKEGVLKIWQDGKLMVDHRGSLGTASGRWKFGLYQGQRTNRHIYVDALKIGDKNSSYAEVAPGGSRPKAESNSSPSANNSSNNESTSSSVANSSIKVEAEAKQMNKSGKGVKVRENKNASGKKMVVLNQKGDSLSHVFSKNLEGNLLIRARGFKYKGAPQMRVNLNGQQLAVKEVGSKSWKGYTIANVKMKKNDKLTVTFINDKRQKGKGDRKINVDFIEVK